MAETSDATDNIQSIPTPQVVPHDYITAAPTYAGGDTPRIFPRQNLTGNSRGVQQFGTPNLFADSGNNYFGVSKSNATGTSVNQVLMGLQPTFGEGFYVTKDGIDAFNATSAEDFIFNSNQNIFKIADIFTFNGGQFTTPIIPIGETGTSEQDYVFNHDFGYIPAVTGYLQGTLPSGEIGYFPVPKIFSLAVNADQFLTLNTSIFATQSQVTIQVQVFLFAGPTFPLSVTVNASPMKIYALQETASI